MFNVQCLTSTLSVVGLMFFLHVDKLLILVVEFILKESQLLRGYDAYTHAVFHLPLALERPEALIDVCGYIGVHMKEDSADANLVD